MSSSTPNDPDGDMQHKEEENETEEDTDEEETHNSEDSREEEEDDGDDQSSSSNQPPDSTSGAGTGAGESDKTAAAASSSSAQEAAANSSTQKPQQPALFSIPADVVRQLRVGTPLIKVGTRGKPMRRHFRVSPNYKWLEWIPSRKASEFVDLDEVKYLRRGMRGEAWEKYKASSKFRSQARELHWHHRNRKTERLSGWLLKKGGAKGGWAVWTKRWFTLTGAQLVYYKSPENPEEKGRIPLEGCEVKDNGDLGFTLEFGPLRPTRELKAEYQEDKDAWVKIIREASAARVRTVVRRSNHQGEEVDEERLAFSIIGKDKGRDVQLLCASLAEFEIWYGGLLLLIAARKKKLEPAEQLFDLCLSNDPDDAFAHVGKGRVAWKRGDYDTSIEWMTAATDKAPDLKGPYVSLADVCTAKGDHEAAVNALRQAYKIAETDERVLLKLSRALLRAGKGDEAMPFLQKLLASDPYNADAHCALGEALTGTGQIDAAEAHFAAALQSNPKFVYAYVNLGLAQEKRGDLDSAIEHYSNAVDIAPSLKSAHLNLAGCYARRAMDSKDHELALYHYKTLLELDPNNVRPYLGASEELHALKRVNEAWDILSQAAEKFSDVADVHAAVGHFYQRVWVDEAPEEAVNAEFVDPNNEDNHCDELLSAIECYKKAAEVDSSHVESLLHLGSLQRRLGRFEEAKTTLQKAQGIIDDWFDNNEELADDESINKLSKDIDAELSKAERLLKEHGATATEEAAHQHKRTMSATAQSHSNSAASNEDSGQEHQRRSTMPYSVPGGVFQAIDRSNLNPDQRSKAFFHEMKKQKEKEEEEKKKQKEKKMEMLSEEERLRLEREQQEKEKHHEKKDKMLKGQLTAYSASQRSVVAGRGRGRGKAKERKDGQ